MRLPARFQTRGVYAVVAFITAFLFLMVFFDLLSDGRPNRDGSQWGVTLGFAFSAVPAALIAWPTRTRRTGLRMIIAGLATVMMAFAMIGLATGLYAAFTSGNAKSLGEDLIMLLIAPPVFVFFGSIFTLGLPYALGLMASLPFREEMS